MTWQPIETAPKDREVLVYDDGAILISLWVEDDGTGGWWDHGFMEPPPTHWMPLPDPPTSGEVTTSAPPPTTEPRLLTDDDWRDIEVAVMRAPTFAAHTRAEQSRLIDKIRKMRLQARATSAPEEPR